MSNGIRGISLLPLLDRTPGAFQLRFPLATADQEALSHSSFPFLLLSDSDSTARVVAASVDTDGGDRVAPLFLLVQKDRYRLGRETLHPVTNVEVERAWGHACAAYRHTGEGCSPHFFEGQLAADGTLSPFAPLFFCKEKGRYFHPPCPGCAHPLSLCTDDAVLAAARLPLYSKSLERYLYCESCSGSSAGRFYAMEVGSGAPAVVRDKITLVREFGKANGATSAETGFPCPGCPDRAECFGPSLKALSRIVPFSFYPFHAFAFDAMSLCAPDFLALLSGAGAEGLAMRLESAGERGRAALVRAEGSAAPILFERGERRFLEILYLKLSFLGELFDCLPPGERPAGPPEFLPSVDRAWVALGAARNLLPRYWNFRTTILDIGRYGEEDASRRGLPGRNDLFFMGTAWFDALLVNAKQDGAVVRGALTERLHRALQGENPPSPDPGDPQSPFFAGNIFHDAVTDPLPDESAGLWERALAVGWSILLAGAGREAGIGMETVAAEIRALRARVRDRMFEEAASASHPVSGTKAREAEPAPSPKREAGVEGDPADAAIAGILDAILRKWSAEAAAAGAPAPPQTKASPPRPRPDSPATDDFMVKTVVLGAKPGPPRPAGAPLIAPPAGPPAAPAPGSSVAPDDAIEKTIILRAGNAPPAPPPAAPPAPDDFLDRTVILGPGKSGVVPPAPEKAKGAGEAGTTPAPEPGEEIDLEKTVILKPPPDPGKIRRHGR